ncbi:MAG: YbaB/EbfC family nucleoid-associated protein [Phycisphaerae bacterium]|jgi:DNA-binding protein YbaB|nr:YbaB/EbfC family nucleoid-associated protein [Phycisphaerae bacterium]
MFDSIKNLGAMAGIMKDLPRIKQKMGEVRMRAEQTRVAASAGGGAVTAVASGKMRIENITIDPVVFTAMAERDDPANRVLAIELVREACNLALESAQQRMAEMLADAAKDLNLPISPEQLREFM